MKAKLFLILTFLFISLSYSQIGFQETVVVDKSYIATSSIPYAFTIISSDMDGDGDQDIIVTGKELSWFENIDGHGAFGVKRIISSSFLTSYAHAEDFDLDGDIDLIASKYPNIYLFENLDGKGNFSVKDIIEVGGDVNQQFTCFSIADLDKDGDKDIVSLYTSGVFPKKTNFVWYENMDGLGSYGTEHSIKIFDASSRVEQIYTHDLDIDGDIEVIAISYGEDKIFWFENTDGNGNFGSENIITTSADGVKSIFMIDLDEDGYTDIISASEKDNKVAWYKNINGTGFGPEQIITTDAVSVQSVYADDLDEDGDMDVLIAASTDNGGYTSSNSKISWYENIDSSNGIYGAEKIISTKAFGAKYAFAKDIDGDGHLDVISSSKDDKKVAYYRNVDGKGNFGVQTGISRSIDIALTVYAADFDGDKDFDIISAGRQDGKVSWYENIDGKGFFSNERMIEEIIDYSSPGAIFPVDIDGDGDMDVAVGTGPTNLAPAKVAWHENMDGKGSFIEHVIETGPTPMGSFSDSYDIDNDGDMDLIFGLTWYENLDGKGSFGPKKNISSGSVSSLHGADLDSDGDIDLIGVSQNSSTNFWYENTDGKGTFSRHFLSSDLLIKLEDADIYTADIDGDNDLDIMAVSSNGYGDDSVSWYENVDGMGNFNIEHNVSTVRISGESIYATDLDNDGDIDILTASQTPDSNKVKGLIAWYENIDGKGDFSEQQIIDETIETIGYSVHTADIDGDGYEDVLSAFGYYGGWNGEGKISWYRNSGSSLSVKEQNNLGELNLHPNPTKDILNVYSNSTIKRVDIYNSLGQVVTSEINKTTIDVSKLSTGLYFVKIKDVNGDTETKKIIKK